MQRTSKIPRAGVLVVAGGVAVSAAVAGATVAPVRASVTMLAATASGQNMTVSGALRVTPPSAAARRRARVVVQINGVDHAYERRTLTPTGNEQFSAQWKTLLSGRLTVSAHATVGGARSGQSLSRSLVVTVPSTSGSSSTGTTPATGSTSPTGTRSTTGFAGQAMLGLFKLTAGSAPAGRTPTGSYVEMLTGSGGCAPQSDLARAEQGLTTFTPGVDGGLSTVAYEAAPSPPRSLVAAPATPRPTTSSSPLRSRERTSAS